MHVLALADGHNLAITECTHITAYVWAMNNESVNCVKVIVSYNSEYDVTDKTKVWTQD